MRYKVDVIKDFAEYAMPFRLSTWILAPPCVLRVEWSVIRTILLRMFLSFSLHQMALMFFPYHAQVPVNYG